MSFVAQLYHILSPERKSLFFETGPNMYHALSSFSLLLIDLSQRYPLQSGIGPLPKVGPTPCPQVFCHITILIAVCQLSESLITLFVCFLFFLKH